MSEAKREAIAQACAELNNVDLPNVYWLTRTLKELCAQYRAVDQFASMSATYKKACAMVEKIEPHLPTNI